MAQLISPSMARLMASLLTGAMLLAAMPASATGTSCVSGSERDALEIKKLSSELMVASEACHDQDQYNAYIRHYQGALSGNEKILNGYFKRAYGRTSQKIYDDFTTDLANVQMQQGLGSGTAFCGLLAEAFDEAMVLTSADELPAFARSKPFAIPASFSTCAAEPARKPGSHRKKKHA